MTFTPRLTIKQVIAGAGVGVGRLEVCLSPPTLLWKGYKTQALGIVSLENNKASYN